MKTSMIICRQALILLVCSSLAWSWGPEGHQIVGRIAALNLSPNASQQVATILGVSVNMLPGEMANAATWADTIRPSAPQTAGWHFVDIPRDQPSGKPSDFCPNNDCVTFRIADFAQRLRDNQAGPDQWTRPQQLKFLIHFVGDAHQPLHCTTNSDRGANCITVSPSKDGNLHHVWDSVILTGLGIDDVALATQFSDQFQALPDSSKQQLLAGTPDDWAVSAHQLAISKVYALLKIPVMNPQIEVHNCQTDAPAAVLKLRPKMNQSYFDKTQPVVQDQLMTAGARLANILNTIWP